VTPAAGLAQESAARLVSCAYAALDLFAGRQDELVTWARAVPAAGDAAGLVPPRFDTGSAAALKAALGVAEVLDAGGAIDPVRALQFRETVELLPHFRAEEARRVPAPRAQVVFTLPEGLRLSGDDGYLARSLAVRLSHALGSAESEPVLLASPFWSAQGAAILRPALDRAVEWKLPITLAGALRNTSDEAYDHLGAMLSFARALHADGATVTALEYRPPVASSRFHAKLACGHTGYLGSANFTDHALGKHVEAGVALAPVDVARVWWLVGVLRDSGLLAPVSF
jgi:phosphatidylserine/phosphatidylglycerophosphate/cardiolipin synthase-like enzyme